MLGRGPIMCMTCKICDLGHTCSSYMENLGIYNLGWEGSSRMIGEKGERFAMLTNLETFWFIDARSPNLIHRPWFEEFYWTNIPTLGPTCVSMPSHITISLGPPLLWFFRSRSEFIYLIWYICFIVFICSNKFLEGFLNIALVFGCRISHFPRRHLMCEETQKERLGLCYGLGSKGLHAIYQTDQKWYEMRLNLFDWREILMI